MRIVTSFISHRTDHLAVNIKNVDQFMPDDIFYFYDGRLQQELIDLFIEKGTPGYVVNDHMTKFDFGPTTSEFYGIPLVFENLVNLLKESTFKDDLKTENCFSFMTNKKQINRYLLIKLVEFFNLTSYDYTWSGEGATENLSRIIDEIEQIHQPWNTTQLKVFLLEPIKIDKKFIPFPANGRQPIEEEYKSPSAFYGGNKWTWDNVLHTMFETSAVALISESLSYQRAAIFTEKTLYSILGLNFPIWIGGAWQADEFKKMGLDSFDDIVNHDYQYCDTLLERCYRAFSDNIELLTNLEKTKKLRKQCYPRFLKNRDLILNGGITTAIDNKIANLPIDVQQLLIPFVNTTWHRDSDTPFITGNDALLQLKNKSQ